MSDVVPEALAVVARILNSAKRHDRRGKRDDGGREDDRHNARHIELKRQVLALTAIHFATYHALCILHVESALRAGNEYREDNHSDKECDVAKSENECKGSPKRHVVCTRAGKAENAKTNETNDLRGKCGDDVCEQDNGNTVAKTLFVDLFSKPHNHCGTCAVRGDNDERLKGARATACGAALKQEVITDCRNDRQNNGCIASEVIDLLFALFSLLRPTLKSGDRNGEKLDNDRRGNVGRDTESKQGSHLERAAREGVHVVKDRAAECRAET